MLIKSLKVGDHVRNLKEMFTLMWRYKMKLNPYKWAFGFKSGRLHRFIVSRRGIEANLEKSVVLLETKSPRRVKEV